MVALFAKKVTASIRRACGHTRHLDAQPKAKWSQLMRREKRVSFQAPLL